MPDTKISALSLAAALADADEFVLNQGGVSVRMPASLIKPYTGDALGNQSTADQAINAAATAYLTGSDIAVPAGKLRIGTIFKWKLSLSKTAAGTAANTFDVRVGTAGTTADTSRLSFTTGTATGVVDQGQIDIMAVVRGPLSASGVMQGIFNLSHELAATGLHNKATRVHHVLSGAFDVTVANLIIGLSCTTAASTVLTFQLIAAEAKNL